VALTDAASGKVGSGRQATDRLRLMGVRGKHAWPGGRVRAVVTSRAHTVLSSITQLPPACSVRMRTSRPAGIRRTPIPPTNRSRRSTAATTDPEDAEEIFI
jgi:hypothetical protein